MLNSKQIQTTPNNEEGNKFNFKGKDIYIIIKYLIIYQWL